MVNALLLSGLVIGLATGPHCVVMCGPACAGMRRACARSAGDTGVTTVAMTGPMTRAATTTAAAAMAGSKASKATAAWQVGRIAGYSLAGAAVAGSVQSLAWVSHLAPWVKPIWVFLHAAMLAWGLTMLVRAKPPAFGLAIARRIGLVLQRQGARVPLLMLLIGMGWAALPCGLLYSALMLSALCGSVAEGAGFMGLFALGSGLTLLASSTIWQRLRGRVAASWEPWATRASGVVLCVAAGWTLIADARGTVVPWCG